MLKTREIEAIHVKLLENSIEIRPTAMRVSFYPLNDFSVDIYDNHNFTAHYRIAVTIPRS